MRIGLRIIVRSFIEENPQGGILIKEDHCLQVLLCETTGLSSTAKLHVSMNHQRKGVLLDSYQWWFDNRYEKCCELQVFTVL